MSAQVTDINSQDLYMSGRPFKRSRTSSFSYGPSSPGRLRQRNSKWSARRRTLPLPRQPRMGGTTAILNRARIPPCRLVKTIVNYGGDQPGAAADLKTLIMFDPSGQYDTSTTAMPDWNNITQCYDQYKVNCITVTVSFYKAGAITQTAALMNFCRHLYDYTYLTNPASFTLSVAQEMNAVKQHVFTEDFPMITCKILPKMALTSTDPGLLAAQGHNLIPHDWTDCQKPCQLFGFFNLLKEAPVNVNLQFDVTYDVSFRSTR